MNDDEKHSKWDDWHRDPPTDNRGADAMALATFIAIAIPSAAIGWHIATALL